MYLAKNFKFRTANPSIFSEFGGELPEILKEMHPKVSYKFCTPHTSAEHGMSKSKLRRKNSVSFIGHLIMATLNQD